MYRSHNEGGSSLYIPCILIKMKKETWNRSEEGTQNNRVSPNIHSAVTNPSTNLSKPVDKDKQMCRLRIVSCLHTVLVDLILLSSADVSFILHFRSFQPFPRPR